MNSDKNKLIIAQRWSLEVSFNDKAINHLTDEQKDSTYEKFGCRAEALSARICPLSLTNVT